MGRTLTLRKCGEHEDCQLESVNGGEWRHTPARTTLARRLARKPEDIEALESKLAGEVGAAIDLRVRLGERLLYLESRLRQLEDSLGALPLVKRLHDEAARIGEALGGSQAELLSKSNRLGRDVERLDRLTTKLEESADEAKERSIKAQQDAASAAETAVHLGERTSRLDAALSRLDDYLEKLSRIDAVLQAVADNKAYLESLVEKLGLRLDDVEHDIRHERSERRLDTSKHQRQLREVMKHVGPS